MPRRTVTFSQKPKAATPDPLELLLKKKEEEAEALRGIRNAMVQENAVRMARHKKMKRQYDLTYDLEQKEKPLDNLIKNEDATEDSIFDFEISELENELAHRNSLRKDSMENLKRMAEIIETRYKDGQRNQAADPDNILEFFPGPVCLPRLLEQVVGGFLLKKNPYVSIEGYCPGMIVDMAEAGIISLNPKNPTQVRLNMVDFEGTKSDQKDVRKNR